jgi:hypothetical protein
MNVYDYSGEKELFHEVSLSKGYGHFLFLSAYNFYTYIRTSAKQVPEAATISFLMPVREEVSDRYQPCEFS